MAIDREDTLKKAEKLLRQGRLDGAIAEYVRVVEDQPRDWTTANTLGDLYVRAGQSDKAVVQYGRIAEHFFQDGFYPKAAAIYKKILKITPDDEATQLQLAELSAAQGLLADAKTYLTTVATRRRGKGDRRGADEIIVRLGSIDPGDLDARLTAARIVAESGETAAAAQRFRELHDAFLEKGREAEALESLREAVTLDPADRTGRATLAKAAVAAGNLAAARAYLDRETAADDPELLLALANIELQSGDFALAAELLPLIVAIDAEHRQAVIEVAWGLAGTNADAAFVCVDAAVNSAIASADFEDAAAVLQEFVTRVPGHIAALLKLVEVCVDGGLETTMYEAQAQLADAYLTSGQAAEARVIAEDLVAREPWERAHIERFRRALVLLRVPEPDTVIAERLSGHTPFTATDHFSDEPVPPPPAPEPEPEPVPEPPVEAVSTRRHAPAKRDPEPEEPAVVSVEVEPEPIVQPPPPKPRRKASVEIDLTLALGELEGASAAPVAPPPRPKRQNMDEVFRDVREGATRKEGPDQSAQHMTLGKTYLEMGMADEAITALRTAARSPRQRFEAGRLLAGIFKERGDTTHMVEWLERAAEVPAPNEEAGRELLYDLGATLETAGETARALAVFLELQADAGDYRDLSSRVDRLARAQAGG